MASTQPTRARDGHAEGAWLGGAVVALACALGACAYGAGKDYTGSGDQTQTDEGSSASTPPPDDTDAGSSPGPPSPPADAGAPQVDAAPAPVDAAPVTCTKTLQSGNVSLSDSVCTDIDTQITKGAVTLTYPCAGGVAKATFGTQAFTGTVGATGQILVTNITNFTLGPCQLEATQTITGTLGTPPLTWSYGERFLGGNCSGDIICTATSKISVN
jgi:hypothetical protein